MCYVEKVQFIYVGLTIDFANHIYFTEKKLKKENRNQQNVWAFDNDSGNDLVWYVVGMYRTMIRIVSSSLIESFEEFINIWIPCFAFQKGV